jgi:hypothetical protein
MSELPLRPLRPVSHQASWKPAWRRHTLIALRLEKKFYRSVDCPPGFCLNTRTVPGKTISNFRNSSRFTFSASDQFRVLADTSRRFPP